MEKTLVLARMEKFLKWNVLELSSYAAKEIHSILFQGVRREEFKATKKAFLYYYYYYLSNSSIDCVAPNGIACSRVLPKTHTDIHITNTINKTKTKLQNKNKL